jgi:hypothetical protein
MKPFFFAFILCIGNLLFAQRPQTLVVKTNGDSLYFGKITAGGNNIIGETDGVKTKLKATEVSFYIEHYDLFIHDGDPPLLRDTTRKCFVPADGKVHEVLIETDSLYLTATIEQGKFGTMAPVDYFVMSRKNVQIAPVHQNKTAPDTLKKYFGGKCAAFDARLKADRLKFDRKIFPENLLWELIDLYNESCIE